MSACGSGGGGGGGGGLGCVAGTPAAAALQQLALSLGRFGLGGPLSGSAGGRAPDARLDCAFVDPLARESRRGSSSNMTECVSVPSSEHVAEIVGRQGCKIKALRAKTNTYIKTPVRGEEPVFVVTGRRDDVTSAKREILSAAEHFSQIRASRRGGGAASGHIGSSSNCCGPLCAPASPAAAASAAAATASGSGSPPGCATIAGGGGGAATSPASQPSGQQVTAMVRVPYRVVGLVVGPKGATIKRIQHTTGTYIVTPSRDKEPVFEVTGMPESVERARTEIERHIASRAGAIGGDAAGPALGLLSGSDVAIANGCFADPVTMLACGANPIIGCGGTSVFRGVGGHTRCGSGAGLLSYRALAEQATASASSSTDMSTGGLCRLDAAKDELLMPFRSDGSAGNDSGCGASLAGDLDCGGSTAGQSAALRLPYEAMSIWSTCPGAPPSCNASRDDRGGCDDQDVAAAVQALRLASRTSAGIAAGIAAGVASCGDGGLSRMRDVGRLPQLSLAAVSGGGSSTRSHIRPGTSEVQLSSGTGYLACGEAAATACGGAFPASSSSASSSSSSGCSSTSTSPVVERRQRGSVFAASDVDSCRFGDRAALGACTGGCRLTAEDSGSVTATYFAASGSCLDTASYSPYPWFD